MSVIKEGRLRHYQTTRFYEDPTAGWHDVHVQLYSDASITWTSNNKTEKVTTGPSVHASFSQYRAPYTGAFVLNTQPESSYFAGPLFASEDPAESWRWMRMINYIRLRNNCELKHPHPVTQRKSKFKEFCNGCSQYISNYALYYECEFCPEWRLCVACQQHWSAFQSTFVNSPRHPFPLVDLKAAKGAFYYPANHVFECDTCHTRCSKDDVLHCVECDKYSQCRACAAMQVSAAAVRPSVMALDVKHLTRVIRVSGDKLTLHHKRSLCPWLMSMTANRCWDLSIIDREPVPHAYFEVTFDTFVTGTNDCVGIGVSSEPAAQNQLLGTWPHSCAYFNTGDVNFGAKTAVEKYPSFGPGDTVGAGILYDSYRHPRVFFTKNGHVVGTVSESLCQGVDYFPGVSFTKRTDVEFVVNFAGPFKFDAKTIANYRHDETNRFEALPPEVLAHCLFFAATALRPIMQLRFVCKQFAKVALDNQIWKKLFLSRWPLQHAKLRLKSWLTLYQRRYAMEKLPPRLTIVNLQADVDTCIENCAFEFECPLTWEELKPSATDRDTDTERFCDTCQKTVYKVDSEETLRAYAEMGRCVSVRRVTRVHDYYAESTMGVPLPPLSYVPKPFESSALSFEYWCDPGLELPDCDEDF